MQEIGRDLRGRDSGVGPLQHILAPPHTAGTDFQESLSWFRQTAAEAGAATGGPPASGRLVML